MSAAAAALAAAVAARAIAGPSTGPEQPSIATAPLVEQALEEAAARPGAAPQEAPLAARSALALTRARSHGPRPGRTPRRVETARSADGSGGRSCGAGPSARVRVAAAFADARPALPVLAAAVATVLLYVLVYLAQRAVNLDGSESSLNPKAPGQVEGELRLYYLATIVLFILYGAVIAFAWRRPGVSGFTAPLLLATPVVVQLGLMLDRPYLSTDVLSYLAHGYVGIARGVGNAYTSSPAAFSAPGSATR